MDNLLLQTVDQKTDTEIAGQGQVFLEKAEAITIVDDTTNALAIAELEEIAFAKKSVEMHRKRFTQPLFALQKAFNKHFADLSESIIKADEILRTKVLQFGKCKTRTVSRYEIVDETKVPSEYWEISDCKIKAVLSAGITEIPGLRIWKEKTPVIGGSNFFQSGGSNG